MTIITIGDSHSTIVHGSWPAYVSVQHLGPKLCYSFGQNPFELSGSSPGDTVIFCLGEIDCRCHVHKYVTETVTYQFIIDKLIEKYIKTIKNAVQNKGVRTCIYNVVPHTKLEVVSDQGAAYPTVGSDEERKTYTLYFNQKVKEKCNENGFIFFDVYDDYADQDGFLKRELSDGSVHIGNGEFIVKKLESLGITP
jgi:hypothetical protein